MTTVYCFRRYQQSKVGVQGFTLDLIVTKNTLYVSSNYDISRLRGSTADQYPNSVTNPPI
jgi:hypothetical protein